MSLEQDLNLDRQFYTSHYNSFRFVMLLILMVTAIFSIGFHHPDEYYQIFEYMMVFQGKAGSSILSPLEMKYQMRPWFQPILFTALTAPLKWFGLSSPFYATLWLRMLTGLLAFANFSLWMKWSYFKTEGKIKYQYLWWFLPYFAIRTSSDTWGAHFALIALALLSLSLLKPEKLSLRPMIIFALFSGLAILFRYQTILIIFPTVLWLIINKKISLRIFFISTFIFIFICLLELPFNYWGYGRWTLASYNHAYTNVVLKISHQFGTMPPWGYFKLIFKSGYGIFGLYFISLTIFFWKKNWKSLLGFTTLFYFIFFCFIGHKEVRFLTPLLFLMPFLILLNDHGSLFQKIKNILYKLNFILLIFIMIKPANRYAGLYQGLYQETLKGETIHVLRDEFDRSQSHLKFELEYFKKYQFHERVIDSKEQLESLSRVLPHMLIATSKFKEFLMMKSMPHCQIKYSSYPQFLFRFNPFNWLSRSSILALWRCSSSQ